MDETAFQEAGYDYQGYEVARLEWPRDHAKFAVREQIVTLFLLAKRGTLFSLLPSDMMMLICHTFATKVSQFGFKRNSLDVDLDCQFQDIEGLALKNLN